MLRAILKSKVHHAHVTQSNVHYEGSITIDRAVMRAADLVAFERVQISSISSGTRHETYVIEGKEGSGIIGINGAAAKLIKKNEIVHIPSYAWMDEAQCCKFKPRVIHLDGRNRVDKIARGHAR